MNTWSMPGSRGWMQEMLLFNSSPIGGWMITVTSVALLWILLYRRELIRSWFLYRLSLFGFLLAVVLMELPIRLAVMMDFSPVSAPDGQVMFGVIGLILPGLIVVNYALLAISIMPSAVTQAKHTPSVQQVASPPPPKHPLDD